MMIELLDTIKLSIKSISIKEIIKCLEIAHQKESIDKIKLRDNHYCVDIYVNRSIYKKIKRFVYLNRLITLDVYKVNEVELVKDYIYSFKTFDMMMIAELIARRPILDSKDALEAYFLFIISIDDKDLYHSLLKIKSSKLYQDLISKIHQRYVDAILQSNIFLYEEMIHNINSSIREMLNGLKNDDIEKFKSVEYNKYKNISDLL
jgi:hypothetical protein